MKNIVLLLFISVTIYSQTIVTIDNSDINIPDGIVYNKASAEKNDLALGYFKNLINGDEIIYEDSPKAILMAPNMWNNLKSIEQFASKPTLPVDFMDPYSGKISEGAAIRYEEKTYLFLVVFQRILRMSNTIEIRKLNNTELKYYWATCVYDLEEPIYIIKTDEHKYIIDMNEENKIFFVDDITFLE
jgi:hypothetical protein